VLTEHPLKKILQKPNLSGRLVNWSVELGQFDIEFHPRTSIKGQILAEFLLEFSNTPENEELPKKETWIAYVDGSSANRKSGVGVTLASPDGEIFRYTIKLGFVTTNNEEEYEVVLAGLSIAQEMGAKNLDVKSDSQVVVSHVQGLADAQGEKMIQYLDKVGKYQSNFDRTVMTKIPREENAQADALSKMGSGTGPVVKTSTRGVVIQIEPSILPKLDMMEVEERSDEPEWATDVIRYLRSGSLPEDKLQSRKVKMHSARYVLIEGSLYRRGYTEPLLKCLTNFEAEYILKEIHKGVCGNHSDSRMLAHKAMRVGY
jgi:ribonuclease HI